jgi:hypothetical protein
MTRREQILQYIKDGFHVVPFTKRDTHGERKAIGKGYFDRPISLAEMQDLLNRGAECDVAIIPKNGCVCLDLDQHEGQPDGIAAFKELCIANGTTIDAATAGCAIGKTYSGNGRHIWYQCQAQEATGFNSGLGIEVIYRNHSVHVAPSEKYEWLSPLTRPEALPPMPDWLHAWWKRTQQIKNTQEVITSTRFKKGDRHDMLVRFAGVAKQRLNLNCAELGALLREVRNTRCEAPEEVSNEELAGIVTYLEDAPSTDFIAALLSQDPIAESIVQMKQRVGSPIIPQVDTKRIRTSATIGLPDDVLYPNRVIGDWVKWSMACNPCQQPELTLISVLTALATMLGRTYRYKNGFANMYNMQLVETGSGKEGIKQGALVMMQRLGYSDLIGGSTIGSEAGLISDITTKPSVLWPSDEMAQVLGALSNPYAPTYYVGICKMILELYTGNTMSGKVLKDKKYTFEKPYPNILGFSQPAPFWKSFNDFFLESGFLGRFFIICGRPWPNIELEHDDVWTRPIPESIMEFAEAIKSEFASILARRTGAAPEPIEVPITPTGEAYHRMLHDRNNALRGQLRDSQNTQMASLVMRDMEKLHKFALVHAWATNPSAVVIDEVSLAWASKLIECSRNTLTYALENKAAANPVEDASRKVLDVIIKAGPGGISRADLTSKTQFAIKERKQIIDDLIESQAIQYTQVATGTRGPKAMMFVATQTLVSKP